MSPLRALVLLAVLSSACALGVAPDIRDTGLVVDEWRVTRDAGVPDDLGFPDDLGAPAMDAPAGDDGPAADLGDAPDNGLLLDLTLPVDVPVVVDRPPVDLGCGATPGRTCAPGERRACGNCGTQTCTGDCEWSACAGGGVCAAGATRTQPCGNCGTQSQRCSAACRWESVGGCAGSGPCAPGATQGGGCDPCSQQVCQSNCNWGGCGLRPGSACEYRAGRHSRSCGACRCGLQFCLGSCQWSTSCVSCCTTCGGCL